MSYITSIFLVPCLKPETFWEYMTISISGCWRDSTTRSLPVYTEMGSAASVEKCVGICHDKGTNHLTATKLLQTHHTLTAYCCFNSLQFTSSQTQTRVLKWILTGYKYAGVQYATQCFCGNEFDQYGEVDRSECSATCRGNRNQKCGGTWRNSVYLTKACKKC